MKRIPTAVLLLFLLFGLFSRGLALADGVLVNLTNVVQPSFDGRVYSQTEMGYCRISHSYGRRLLLQAAYQDALPALQAGTGCDWHRWAWFDLGRAQWALGQAEAASTSWQEADAYAYVARLATQATATAVAADYWQLAQQVEPTNAEPLVRLGDLALTSDPAQAAALYQQATAVDATYAPAYFALGQYYLRHLGQPETAYQYHQQAYLLAPSNVEYVVTVARQAAEYEPTKVIGYWQQAVALRPQNGEIWYELGAVYQANGCMAYAEASYIEAATYDANLVLQTKIEAQLAAATAVDSAACPAEATPPVTQ